MHRLWACPANLQLMEDLYFALSPGARERFADPASLPPCLARCGLIPSDCPWLLPDDRDAVMAYLLRVSQLATDAFVQHRWLNGLSFAQLRAVLGPTGMAAIDDPCS